MQLDLSRIWFASIWIDAEADNMKHFNPEMVPISDTMKKANTRSENQNYLNSKWLDSKFS